MIWLTWRQHRRALLVAGIAFVGLAVYLLVMGHVMYAAYTHDSGGISPARCLQQHSHTDFCNELVGIFQDDYVNDQRTLVVMLALPLLLGMFLGAPLIARELESGTFRLAWTQSVTRLRWLLARVGTLGGMVLLAIALLIPLILWRHGPFPFTGSDMGSETFAIVGFLPLAYTAFALALGIAAGTLLRHVVPAIFATLAGYLAVALAIANWARPNWLPPLTETWDPSRVNGPSRLSDNAWLQFLGYTNQSGQQLEFGSVFQACAPDGHVDMRPDSPFTNCVHAHGWLGLVVWQPSSRFWIFQGIESTVLLLLALLLLMLAIYWVRKRLN